MEKDLKYLDYEGLKVFKLNLEHLRLLDKNDIINALNEVANSINDGKISFYVNNVKLDEEFTANLLGNTEINLSIPTTLRDLNNSVEYIKNVIKYGQPDVSELSEQEKEALHNQTSENLELVSNSELEETLTSYGTAINYDSEHLKILLLHNNALLSEIDAAPFIKDSMIQNISVTDGTGNNLGKEVLLIDFNTDSGITDIEIPLEKFFDPNNYYSKEDFASVATSGDYNDLSNTPNIPEYSLYIEQDDAIENLTEGFRYLFTKDNEIISRGEIDFTFPLSNWNEDNEFSPGYIQNKPDIYTKDEANNTFLIQGEYLTEHQSLAGYATESYVLTKINEFESTNNILSTLQGKANSSDLAAVALSGSYNDLLDKPESISEERISELINTRVEDSNNNTVVITSTNISDYLTQVDWNLQDDSAIDFIKNKPDVYTKGEVDQKVAASGIFDSTQYYTKSDISSIIGNLGNKQEAIEAVYYTQLEADEYNTEHNLQEGDEDYKTTESIKEEAQEAIPYENVKDAFYTKNLIHNIYKYGFEHSDDGNITEDPWMRVSEGLLGIYRSKILDFVSGKDYVSNHTTWLNKDITGIFDANGDGDIDVLDMNTATSFQPYAYGFILDYAKNFYGKQNDFLTNIDLPTGSISFKDGTGTLLSSFTANQTTNSTDITVYTLNEIKNIATYGIANPTDEEKTLSDTNGLTTATYSYINTLLLNYTPTSGLTTVAITGSYNDLSDKPTLFNGNYNNLTNKPTLVTDYNGLSFNKTSATVASSGLLTISDATKNIIVVSTGTNVAGIKLNSAPEDNHSCHIIIKATSNINVTINTSNSSTTSGYNLIYPDSNINLTVNNGNYCEFDILRVGSDLFIRGV